ncbi:MAG: hypothetical protein FRX49_00220 [Trebouxia sp. A1-2]|nr:MAG: hypothetical protein FRX49_00220 [Trebouxia sp. A1-2]
MTPCVIAKKQSQSPGLPAPPNPPGDLVGEKPPVCIGLKPPKLRPARGDRKGELYISGSRRPGVPKPKGDRPGVPWPGCRLSPQKSTAAEAHSRSG